MKKAILILNFLALSILLSAQTPKFNWAISAENDRYSSGHSIVTDASGNVYTTGAFSGVSDFDPGPGEKILIATSKDIFISKCDPNGNLLWVKKVGGSSYDISKDIVLDASNNVYITGYFYSTADFDPGPGVFNLEAVGVHSQDAFILKLTKDGDFVWAKRVGGGFEDQINSINVDVSGNVYTAGYFYDTVDFDPGPGVFKLVQLKIGSDHKDGFILKLNSSGNFVWVQRVGGYFGDACNSITSDKFGNTYTTGSFMNIVDFDAGSGIFELRTNGTIDDAFILKLDSSGNFIWAKSITGQSDQIGYSIALDVWGNIYTTGMFESTPDFDPGAGTYEMTAYSRNVFILKLKSSGDFIWAKDMGMMDLLYSIQNDDAPPYLWGTAIDKHGYIYRIGSVRYKTDLDPGSGVFNIDPNGYDMFITKLDSGGKFIWAQATEGKLYEVGNDITVDNKGNIYTTGWFQDTVDFDLSAAKSKLVSIGYHALFICKYGEGTGAFKNIFSNNNLSVYPNPTNSILNIDNINNTYTKVQIINSLGQILLDEPLLLKHSSIDIKKLPSGLLIVKVIEKGNVLSVQKILKQ